MQASHAESKYERNGFTLIEMMVVMAIMLTLVSIAIPAYNQTIIRSHEAVLRQNLFTLRSVINQYTGDKEKAPQSLDDLVSAGYLKRIPVDPITHSDSTWQLEQEQILNSVDQREPGISDVHSGSTRVSTEGTPYNEW
jgi:general secretion pathway protein G